MRIYLASFVLVAAFGIFQLVSPSMHLGTWLVTQWVRHGSIPRINAFSYEPSFFATYLIMGWVTVVDLKASHAKIVAGPAWTAALVLLTATLILSTSKIAFLMVIVEGLARLAPILWKMSRNQLSRLRTGSLVIPMPRPNIFVRVTTIILVTLALLVAASKVIDPSVLLAGTGVNNTAAHSVLTRAASYEDTLEVIRQHPFIGRSLGGVPAELAALHGASVSNVDELRPYWGFPVPVDIFAASGLFGFLPFVWFFYSITFGERNLLRTKWPDERAKWLHALIRALIFEWLCFLADQNMMRVYFWFHVTMVVIVGYNLRYANSNSHPTERLATA